ncbi:MAG: HD domain-containing protein [Myxococcales bacterium]
MQAELPMTTTLIHDGDSGLPALPQTSLAREVLQLVTGAETPSIANHSIRSYLYARLVAAHRLLVAERDYDPDLLFFACVLHDIGLSEQANAAQRFEVAGADFAAEFLTRRGLGAAQVDIVWQAIALNTSLGIAERRGAVCALTLAGVSVDFGVDAAFIPDATAAAIHRAYPRISIGRALADAVVAQARGNPANAPPFSMPAQLLMERNAGSHLTTVEQLAQGGRWGD